MVKGKRAARAARNRYRYRNRPRAATARRNRAELQPGAVVAEGLRVVKTVWSYYERIPGDLFTLVTIADA